MSAGRSLVVFQKEIKDLLRDKRTLIVSIIIPIVIFPVIFGFMNINFKKNAGEMENNLKIAVIDKASSLKSFLKTQTNLTLINSINLAEDVDKGTAHIAVIIPDGFDKKLASEKTASVTILQDNTSQISIMAAGRLNAIISAYAEAVVRQRIMQKGLETSLLKPVTVSIEAVKAKENSGTGLMILSLILPLLLLIYSATGPLAAAIDLGAGEKERGTLEPLLATQAKRLDLLTGKFLAISVMGIIGVLSFIAGFFISFKMSPGFFAGENLALVLRPLSLGCIAVFTVMLTMTFGAAELAVSIYARSSREAQAYLAPAAIVSMAAGYSTFMMDIKNISINQLHIPLVNISIVIKELVVGIYQPFHIAVTFVWTIIYILLAFLLARLMFSREDVIFRS